jgi:epoxyqueuosine reductase
VNLEKSIDLTKKIKKKAFEEGFDAVGVAKVPGSSRIKLRTASLERWLQAGHQAKMEWMKSPRRKNIENMLKGVQSVLAVGLNYHVETDKPPTDISIARYGWGHDYHKVIEKKLKIIAKFLEVERPNSKWKICVDTSAFLDKAWAEEAGIGWIGKHSNIINPKIGSWMFLGHLLSTEALIPDEPSKPICGECEQCIEACPTKAIEEPFIINSNKCLAYHTLENRDHKLPINIINKMGNWIAGCDICQEVCPWNHKNIPSTSEADLQPSEWILNITKKDALSWSDSEWKEKLSNSALKRIKPWMWRRNIKSISSHQ